MGGSDSLELRAPRTERGNDGTDSGLPARHRRRRGGPRRLGPTSPFQTRRSTQAATLISRTLSMSLHPDVPTPTLASTLNFCVSRLRASLGLSLFTFNSCLLDLGDQPRLVLPPHRLSWRWLQTRRSHSPPHQMGSTRSSTGSYFQTCT